MELIASSISKIHELEAKYGRPKNSVLLLAVSKKKSPEQIVKASRLGISHFGENYLQEAIEKINKLREFNEPKI